METSRRGLEVVVTQDLTIGELIKRRRKELGLPLQGLAKRVGLRAAQSVLNWESGVTVPRIQQIKKLASVLKMDFEVLADRAEQSRAQGDLVKDAQAFSDLMYLMGHATRGQVSFYIICQKTLTLENPTLAATIARLAWNGVDIVYVYLNSRHKIWEHNMDSAFEGFEMSLSELSRGVEGNQQEKVERNSETARQRILRFNECRDEGAIGLKHAAMISPFLTAVFRCCDRREEDMLWFALQKDLGGAVWHKLPYAQSQAYRNWISHDLGIDRPFEASSEANAGKFESLQAYVNARKGK